MNYSTLLIKIFECPFIFFSKRKKIFSLVFYLSFLDKKNEKLKKLSIDKFRFYYQTLF